MLQNNYLLTNCLTENEGDRELYEQVERMAMARGSLLASNYQGRTFKASHNASEKRERWKSINPQYAEDDEPLLSIYHPNFFEFEVSKLSAEDEARRIMDYISRLRS